MTNNYHDADHCYECTGYGDDYYIDDDGELVSACKDCLYDEDLEEDLEEDE